MIPSSPPIFTLSSSPTSVASEERLELKTVEALIEKLREFNNPKVLILNLSSVKHPEDVLQDLSQVHPDSLWLIETTANLNPQIPPTYPQFFGYLGKDQDNNQKLIEDSLERISEIVQEADLLSLLRSQNSKLIAAHNQISKPHKKTNDQNSSRAHLRMKTLEGSLIEILKARSVSEIERALKKSLTKLLPVEFVRIFFDQQSSLISKVEEFYMIKVPLQVSESRSKSWLVLGFSKKKVISEKDFELVEEVAEIASLSVNRILQLEASESLKQQWDATFDAISDPLCLVDEGMVILRTNKAFSTSVGLSYNELIGENSLKIFFKDNPEIWKTPPPFNLKIQVQHKLNGKSYSLVIHDLKFKINDKNINLLLIKDVTDQMRLEKQIREKSKLVELGTIGSSIAHELNNPLAGMLSYLQLLLMDAEKQTEFYDDLKEMEAATLRCRDIVQSLLGFSRKQTTRHKVDVDLNELIGRAIQLVELKSRFKRVHIGFEGLAEEANILGDQNSLVQAFTHILTNSVEALEESVSKEASFMASINVTLIKEKSQFRIRITDNGPGISEKHLPLVINPLFTTKTGTHHAGLGLTVAYSIFSEHDGSLEIESQSGQGVTAIISLPRPENERSSRGIDTQI